MAENIKLNATERTVVGKANRRLDAGELAAVLYGASVDSKAVAVSRHEFEQLLAHHANISSQLIDLSLDGAKPLPVIIKGMQHDALKGAVTHVDFWAVNLRKPVSTNVAVHTVGDAPGAKAGGVFMHNLGHVTVEALPDDLPEFVEVDVSALEVGDSVHVRDIVVPKGVTIHTDADEIVASVVAPAKEEELGAEEEITEPEVIGESSDEE